MVDTVMPRAMNSGISAVIRVVLPLPLHPARPKMRIAACRCEITWELEPSAAMRALGGLAGFAAADGIGARPAGDVRQPGAQIVVAGHQGQYRRDPQQTLADRLDRQNGGAGV